MLGPALHRLVLSVDRAEATAYFTGGIDAQHAYCAATYTVDNREAQGVRVLAIRVTTDAGHDCPAPGQSRTARLSLDPQPAPPFLD